MERDWYKFYDTDVPREFDYPELPLFELVENAAKRYPRNTACIFFGKKLTYSELQAFIDKLASSLQRLGVRKGERVALQLPNCPQYVISFFAILKCGGVVVNTNPLYVEREMEEQFRDAGVRFLITLDLTYPRAERIREAAGIEEVITTSVRDFLPFPLNLLYALKHWVKRPKGERIYEFRELLKGGDTLDKIDVKACELALLQYTGGTTGIPKGVMLTHYNVVTNAIQISLWFSKAEVGKEVMLAVLPFFHVYGMTVSLILSVYLGAAMILLPRFEIEKVLKSIVKYRPTLFPGVPTIYVAINNHPKTKSCDLSSIKYCLSGAAPLPLEVLQEFEGITGGKLREGYGLSEASPVTHCNPLEGIPREGSIGLPIPDTDARIVSVEEGKELVAGEVGELCIRGPQVMSGFWRAEEETKEVLKDNWLYTGDLGKMDEDGYFYIVDRKKDMIISGGYNIYPREIDEVLFEHPGIREAVAVGIPDPWKGEVVKAYVVLKEGQQAGGEEIIEYCRQRLAAYKVPRYVEFRNELPKSLVGKVLRKVLKEEEIEGRTQEM